MVDFEKLRHAAQEVAEAAPTLSPDRLTRLRRLMAAARTTQDSSKAQPACPQPATREPTGP